MIRNVHIPVGIRRAALCAVLLILASAVEAQTVSLNELMAANASTLADREGDFNDWFELYNAATAAVDLTGFGLSDDPANPFKWSLPLTSIDAGGYLVVFASGKDTAGFGGVWDAVVTQGDAARYLSGSQPPSTWTDTEFDDSAWNQGPSGIGYGDGDDATIIPTTLSVFTRFTFEVVDAAAVGTAQFHIDYDDGFVAYLNGTEIARANLGLPGSFTPHDRPADTFTEPLSVRGLPPQRYLLPDAGSLIRSGTNTLAVQVHNSSLSSSDLTCIPYLTLGLESASTSREPAAEIHDSFVRELHTSFRLSADGEELYLTDKTGQVIDSVLFGPLRPDVSLGRQPDGTGPWYFFDIPSPGAPNASAGYLKIASPPVFSLPGGRFDAPVTISLSSAPGLEIRYSTDGSTPDEQSILFLAPVPVSSPAVLRARTLAPGYLPSEVVTHSYVVGEDARLPIISISTDPPLLWDNDTGIYAFPPEDQAACPSFPHFCANFWEDREVPSYVEIFDPAVGTALRAGAGLTIIGGWSRAYPQKSLGLFARGRYGNSAFESHLFPDRRYDTYQSFLLRNSGNDWDSSMLRDGYLQTIVAQADVDRMAYRPAVVYLNGQYWGIHNLREKINEHYAGALGSRGPDEVDLLGLEEDHPTSDPLIIGGDAEHFQQLIALVSMADMSTTATLESVSSMMDLESFIDYQVTQIFVGNTDWPGNNVKLWRPRTTEGRWRWILFDLDFGFGRWNPDDFTHNTLAFAAEPNGPQWPNPPWSTLLFRRLLENPTFRVAFANRYADFLNSMFRKEQMLGVLDSLQAAIVDEMPDHLERWGQSYDGWLWHMSNLRYYARNRPAAAQSHLRSFFGLGSPAPITVSATVGGHVRVNRLEISDFPWTGSYYSPFPVPLIAVPEPGHRFVGWSGHVESDERSISVVPTGALSLQASFERAPAREYRVVINEIQYNAPADMPSEDWVELLNLENETIDLSGWSLSDGGGNTYPLPEDTVIPPAGFIVLARDTTAFSSVYSDVKSSVGGWAFGLSNGGETVYLYDDVRLLVDSVSYSDTAPWPIAADGAGATLELVDPEVDNGVASNWRASTPRGGTPGRPNSVAVGVDEGFLLPDQATLGIPYPNPVRTSAVIAFGLSAPEHVSIQVFDALGRHIATVLDEHRAGGYQWTGWDTAGYPSGVYLIRMTTSAGHAKSVKAAIAH